MNPSVFGSSPLVTAFISTYSEGAQFIGMCDSIMPTQAHRRFTGQQ